MALADYKAPKAEIACPGGVTFEVRALSLSDLSAIVRIHRDATEAIVEQLGRHAEVGISVEVMVETVITMIAEAPPMMATVIAFASDEPDQIAQARDLPLAVSVDALNRVGELTFTDIASLKKTIASVKQLISGAIPEEMRALATAA